MCRFLRAALHLLLAELLRALEVLQRKEYVLLHRQVRIECIILKHHAHAAILGCKGGHIVLPKENLSLRRLFQAADHEQRGALAAAGRAEQPHQLSVRKFIIKIAHRNDILSPFAGAGELLGQVLQNNLHDSLYPLFLAPAHSAQHGLTPML